MSSINRPDPTAEFYLKLSEQNLAPVANYFPKEGMQSFDVKTNGKFTIVYNNEKCGKPEHTDYNINNQLGDVTVKIRKTITGTIDAATKTVFFDADCISIKKGSLLTVSLAHAKAKAGGIEFVAKWVLFQKGMDVSLHTAINGRINWT